MNSTETAYAKVELDGKEAEYALAQIAEKAKAARKELKELLDAGNKDGWKAKKEELDGYNQSMGNFRKVTIDVTKTLKDLNGASLKDLTEAQRVLTKELNNTKRGTDEWIAKNKQLKEVSTEVNKVKASMSGVAKETSAFDKLKDGFAKIIPVVAAAWAGIQIGKKIMESTGDGADYLEEKMAAVSSATNYFFKSIATGDFENFIQGLKDAAKAGEEYAKSMDDLENKKNQVEIIDAKNIETLRELRKIVNDVNKTNEERIAAIDKINEIEKKSADAKTNNAKQEFDAYLNKIAKENKLSQEEILMFQENYDQISSYLDLGKEYTKATKAYNAYNDAVTESGFKTNDDIKELDKRKEAIDKVIEQGKLLNIDIKYFADLAIRLGIVTDEELKKNADNYKNVAKAADEEYKIIEKNNKKKSILLKQLNADQEEYKKRSNEAQKWLSDQQLALQKKLYDDLEKLNRDYQNRNLTANQKELAAIDDKYRTVEKDLEENLAMAAITQQQYEQKKYDLSVQKNGEKDETIAKQEAKLNDRILELQNELVQGNQAEYSKELQVIIKKYDKEKELAKENAVAIEEIEKLKTEAINQLNSKNAYQNLADRSGAKAKFGLNNNSEEQQLDELDLQKTINDGLLKGEEEIGEARRQIKLKYLEKDFKDAQQTTQLLGQLATVASDYVTLQKDKELSASERAKAKELALAGDNATKKKQIEEKYAKEQLAIKKKYADKEFALTVANIIATTAQAAMNAFTSMAKIPYVGPVLGGIAAAAAIASGAIQIDRANEARKEVQQLAKGRYDVVGADDGRSYSAKWGGEPQTGLYTEPTLVADHGTEMVFNARDTRAMQLNYPEIFESIRQNRGVVPQQAQGNVSSTARVVPSSNNNEVLIAMVAKLNARLDEGITARISYTHLNKEMKRMDKVYDDVKR